MLVRPCAATIRSIGLHISLDASQSKIVGNRANLREGLMMIKMPAANGRIPF
jgi:hypothetical protein